MGAPAVDLPDPLDETAIPDGPAAGNDDLLSQLASDEIDRLLAEDADESAPPTSATSTADQDAAGDPHSPVDPAAASSSPQTAQAHQAASPIAEPAGDASVEPAAASQEFNAADLDATLAAAVHLKSEDLNDVDFTQASVQSVSDDPDFPGGTEDTDAAARAMLAADEFHAVAVDDGDSNPFFDEDDNSPVPWPLRPLVWLNAPLNLLPDPLRNATGKVALITLFNALGVLAYVLIFRNH